MTERAYRLVVGILLLIFLFFRMDYAIWMLIIIMTFEAITNWRIPILVSKALYSNNMIEVSEGENPNFSIEYDAERMLRWVVMLLTLLSVLKPVEHLFWYFPWFVGLTLIIAGVTGICPMVMALRKIGMK